MLILINNNFSFLEFGENLKLASVIFPRVENKEEFLKNLKKLSVKVYENAKTEKKKILNDNKGKSGIYLWYNNINNKYYIGQSKELGNIKGGRLANYYRLSYLQDLKNKGIISKSLIKYGHSNFSLIILEYCPIDDLDTREQFWINYLEPEYNILKIVKSSYGGLSRNTLLLV